MNQRKVTPEDVINAAEELGGDGELERMAGRIRGLERLCEGLVMQLSPEQQLAAVRHLYGGTTVIYDRRHGRVELVVAE